MLCVLTNGLSRERGGGSSDRAKLGRRTNSAPVLRRASVRYSASVVGLSRSSVASPSPSATIASATACVAQSVGANSVNASPISPSEATTAPSGPNETHAAGAPRRVAAVSTISSTTSEAA